MEYQEITEKIIGCAFRVYNQMGYGYLESVYEKCMIIELKKSGLNIKSQKQIKMYYEGQLVGEFIADLFVEDNVIVELKSVRKLNQAHEVQLVNYLISTGKPVGLLLNFGDKEVEIRRKIRDLNDRSDRE